MTEIELKTRVQILNEASCTKNESMFFFPTMGKFAWLGN